MENGDEARVSFEPAGSQRCRRPGSRLCHGLLGLLFFLMMAVALSSLAIFTVKHNSIDENLHTGDAKCILYTTKSQLKDEKLSKGAGCEFTIWGSGVVAVLAGIFMLGYVFKAVYGASLSSCLVCVELPVLLLLFTASLAVSINTSLGLGLACRNFNDANENSSFFHASGSNCKDYTITKKDIKFFEDMVTSSV
jgi:hypothetical protein